jgi:hypothetical protein
MSSDSNPRTIHLASYVGNGDNSQRGDARIGSAVMAESEAGYSYARIIEIINSDVAVIVFRDDLKEIPYKAHRDKLSLVDSE